MGDLDYKRLFRLGVVSSAEAEEFARVFEIRMSRRPIMQPLNNGACETAVMIPVYWPVVEQKKMKWFLQGWNDSEKVRMGLLRPQGVTHG